MLAYASDRRIVGKRESSPNALLVVIAIHVGLLAAVMSAKMDMSPGIPRTPPLIPIPLPPPAPPPTANAHPPRQQQHPIRVTDPKPIIDTHPLDPPPLETKPDGDVIALDGNGEGAGFPSFPSRPVTTPIRHGAELLTPPSELKPPYPASKLAAEEQATLRLTLTIDERGRVTAVEPVGRADREFLEAARRYIIAHWRYRPASEDGRPVSSTISITLDFQLEG